MTRIETEVYKQAADDLIGLRVIVYDDAERQINNIIVVQPEDLIRLETGLVEHNHDNKYVSIESVSQRIRQIAEELFATTQQQNYRPPTFYVEDDGDFYVEYHEGELITHDEIAINLENRHIITYDGNFIVTGLITNNDEPLINRDVLIYNLNDSSEHYFTKTNREGIITFNLSLDIPTKTYRVSTSGAFTDVEVNYHYYNINSEVGTIADEDGNAIIYGILQDWNNIVENEDIQLILDDNLIDTQITNENGEVFFNVIITETTYYKFKYTLPDETFIEKEYGVQFNEIERERIFTMDDAQYIKPIEGGSMQFVECDPEENNGAEFYITGNNSYIDLPWDNNLWEFECEIKLNYQSGLSLVQSGIKNRDRNAIYFVNDSDSSPGTLRYLFYWGEGNWNPQNFTNNIDWQNIWYYITIKKTSAHTILLEVYNLEDKENSIITRTFTHYACGLLKDLCLGFTCWQNQNQKTQIRNAKVKYINFTNYVLKEIYSPLLDGHEQLTSTQYGGPLIDSVNHELYNNWGEFCGYLTEGFPNTESWEVKFDVKLISGTSNAAGIYNKGVTRRDSQILKITGNGKFYSCSSATYDHGEWRTSALSSSEWRTITFKKINNEYIQYNGTGTNTPYNIVYWNNTSYSNICVGIDGWSSSHKIKIKNIHVKTSLEERE